MISESRRLVTGFFTPRKTRRLRLKASCKTDGAEGFVVKGTFYVLHLAESNMPTSPKMPPLPRRIARYGPLAMTC